MEEAVDILFGILYIHMLQIALFIHCSGYKTKMELVQTLLKRNIHKKVTLCILQKSNPTIGCAVDVGHATHVSQQR